MSYHANIINATQENEHFQRVLFTSTESQLVVMSIPIDGEVGEEIHEYSEQTLFFLTGTAEGTINGQIQQINPGDVVVISPGTKHNFRNTGQDFLKIYTVYTPPNHLVDRIHRTKADADADTADEEFGHSKPTD